jgi:hypothetical protein
LNFVERGFRRGAVVPALVFVVSGVACSESLNSSDVGGGASSGGAAAGAAPGSGGALVGGSKGLGGALASGGGTAGAGGGGTESGGQGAGGEPNGATWATTEQRIGYSCGNSICHGGSEKLCLAKDADRTGGQGSNCLPGTNLFQTLLGTRVPACGDRPLLSPGDPSSSAILLLMTRQCEDLVMPANCPPPEQGYPTCWPEDAVADLTAWIQSGALQE